LHRTRHLFIRQQTAVINAIRAHLAEFGVVAPVGRKGVEELLKVVADASDQRVPEIARACVASLGAQLRMLKAPILAFDRRIMAWDETSQPGLVSCRSSTQAEAKTSSVPSARRETATCAAYLPPGRWRSSVMPRSTGRRTVHGSRRCWHVG